MKNRQIYNAIVAWAAVIGGWTLFMIWIHW